MPSEDSTETIPREDDNEPGEDGESPDLPLRVRYRTPFRVLLLLLAVTLVLLFLTSMPGPAGPGWCPDSPYKCKGVMVIVQ